MKTLLLILLALTITTVNLKAEKLQGQERLDSLLAELPKAKGDTNKVKLLASLSFENYSTNVDESIAFGLKGLKLSNKIKWEKGKANCYNSLGTCYLGGKNNFPKALEYFKKALVINEKLKDKKGISYNLGNMGTIYFYQLNYSKAIEYYQRAIKINLETGDSTNLALNIGDIGNVYTYQSNYPMALEYYQKALKINERIENKNSIALNLGNIGTIYNNLSNHTKALEYTQKSVKIFEELGNKSSFALNLGNLGNIYTSLLDYPKALECYFKSIRINEELGNKTSIAIKLGNIASIYTYQSNYPKALEYFEKAININKEVGSKIGLAYNYAGIGYLYLTISQDSIINNSDDKIGLLVNREVNLNKSIEYTTQSILLYEEMGELDQRSSSLKTLSEAYELKGDYKKAFESYKEHKELQDSVFSQENTDKIATLEKAREDDLKQKEIEKQKIRIVEQEKREKLILYFSIGLVLLMAVVMLVIYRLLKRSDKLLYNVLPVSIAKRLKKKEHPISDYFTQASIVFIDIVNFTEMAQDADPQALVSNLNTIFTKFDTIAKKYGLEKIKTIGDSYMAAAGIPEVQKDNTHRAAQMALEVKSMMEDYHTTDGTKIEVRIGLDCGPVVAGVIGENKFIYDMWSDAVNTASRMESSSIAGEVHVSERFKEAVTEYEQFDYEERGEIEIKGKGKMKTFFMGSKAVEAL
ncbi:MAG: hypothetical protein CVV25_03425 [Ignavibacteriae bacterium HGW-Ignavibacteriae-4]|jgi:class 3 adenylate cyclase/TPR repeat protein|nr:MAG: hypothetical protein CVV25_03425 [Ignavibacteriae bacterium HGW-Ignavibacteriae-4]